MAEGLFRLHLGKRRDIGVGSAGVAASKGSAASRETVAILKKLGTTLDGFASRPVTSAMLSEVSHVFAMTRGHLDVLESRFPEHSAKFFLLREFAGPLGKNESSDIPDPFGMDMAAYHETAEILRAAMPSVLAYIDSTEVP